MNMTSPHPSSGEDAFVPSAKNTRRLRDAFGKFATGVTIITAQTPDGPLAITANSFSSVSLDPAMVLWCIDKRSKRFDAFAQAQHYAIHVLSQAQSDLCWNVARDGQCLRDAGLHLNHENVPILTQCLARFECRQHQVHEAGDHAIILGHVLRATLAETGDALTFFDGNIRALRAKN